MHLQRLGLWFTPAAQFVACEFMLHDCRWLSVRLETLGALAAFSAATLAIEAREAA